MLTEKICPYPGLRPFSEDESIFFKGREEHIDQIISQLEQKKFVMLTGASGDGKSSLVYAGVIPNARAGFFKAKHNNWLIADFRPERTPLHNLTKSLAESLQIRDEKALEKELSSGYSALVNTYKKSSFYLDTDSDQFKKAEEAEKKKLKRKAANLFILVDQFEEFFTNTENFNQGKSSLQSQLTVNLLLETAKIALNEDLPIYIICTMRSDYVGQCASFRGLPEYIGFSQFFVPRLKRKELVQVIEEPALLSGTKITKRLTEVLIGELNEGIDQLPVLQHALNRIWQMANSENAEMDLIHFAKLCGMPSKQLPPGDELQFNIWFDALPEFKKPYFQNPSLTNVLDAHANELLETADVYYSKNTGNSISKNEVKLIITAAFKSLTKIDENRAVRNRMTLQEITEIVNDRSITSEKISGVINIFREQGNTFIRPFITENPKSKILNKDSLLDITHESLIRNWNLLVEWTKQEETDLLNFLDFEKQVQRWVNNNESINTVSSDGWITRKWKQFRIKRKSKTFLLPKGPLAFFDGWFKTANINLYWLMKYDERDVDKNVKNKTAQEKINNLEKFLSKSRNVFTRRKYWMIGSFAWALFWLCYSWYSAVQSMEEETVKAATEKSKAEKLATELLFDQLAVKVVAPSSYVMTGNEYTSDIFISAGSSKLDPLILIGTLDSLGNITNVTDTVRDGTYRKTAEEPGSHSYEGVIQIKNPNGSKQNYPFSSEYIVTAPSLAVSSDKMNVMYMGVDNPMSVSVSGVSPADLVVKVSPGTITQISPSHYNMRFTSDGETSIEVGTMLKGGKIRPAGPPVRFRIKKLPNPYAFIGQYTASSKIKRSELLKIKVLEAKIIGFDYNIKCTIESYSVTLISGTNVSKIINNTNAGFNSDVIKLINNSKAGDRIIFDNIQITMSDGTKRIIAPISLEIN